MLMRNFRIYNNSDAKVLFFAEYDNIVRIFLQLKNINDLSSFFLTLNIIR